MQKAKLEQASMEIILNAGDGRNHIMNALDYCSEANFTKAYSCLKKARTFITKAHQAQTAIMQEMITEENIYSILFSHAQDTLMTIMTEINLTEKLIVIFEKMEGKNKCE
jgi:Phosphotransferase system cellobiose-specific component IIA